MMNIPSPLHFRCVLMLLLLGAQWCGVSLVPYQAAMKEQRSLAEEAALFKPETAEASVSKSQDFSTPPALLRFNGKTLVGLEDSLTLYQEIETGTDLPLVLPFDATGGFRDTIFAGSTALAGQSLFLQHTRLQI